jgi:hypothetical protein
MKTVIEFTKMNEDGTVCPCSIDADEVLRIDYGNYGEGNDRHFWPGVTSWNRPLLIIYTNGETIIAMDSLKFRQYGVLPPYHHN